MYPWRAVDTPLLGVDLDNALRQLGISQVVVGQRPILPSIITRPGDTQYFAENGDRMVVTDFFGTIGFVPPAELETNYL
jgi:hypothetical protein